uniref:F-box domain-containing protein n=1 Tax=Eutreptiella gymnastica TaxID=73025 RepID=A0A7S1J7W3_9EUGL
MSPSSMCSLGSTSHFIEHILPSELWAKVYAFVDLKQALYTRLVSIELARGVNTYLQQLGSNEGMEQTGFRLTLKLADETEMARDMLLAKLSVAKHLSGPYINLDLSGCGITNRNTHWILKALEEPSTIQRLQLVDNRLGISGIKEIAEGIRVNNSMEDLNLGHCGIADRGARAVGAALEENSRLRGLNLAGNQITDDGVVALARGLISNSGLNALDLTGNHLTCLAAEVVAEALQVNGHLKALAMNGTGDIQDPGCIALAQALTVNNSLQSLSVAHNPFTCKAITALADTLLTNKSLTHLNISSTSTRDEGATSLAMALAENHALVHLNLGHTLISSEGALAFADAFRVNTTLQTLNLASCSVKDNGAAAIADALLTNDVMLWVNLSFNPLTEQVANNLSTLLHQHNRKANLHFI